MARMDPPYNTCRCSLMCRPVSRRCTFSACVWPPTTRTKICMTPVVRTIPRWALNCFMLEETLLISQWLDGN